MATEIKLPRLGQGMESGTIVRWLKSEGEPVEKGEPLYELDTDKVTQEVEADASGVLLRIAVEEGEVEVGRTIAPIGQEGESVPDEAPAPAPEEPAKPEAKRAAPAPETSQQTVARSDGRDGGRIKASPLARRIARERGIELSSLQGTGPEGRIVAEGVERAAASPARSAPAPPAEAPAGAGGRGLGPRRAGTRRQAPAGRPRGRDVHDLEPRHVRRRAVRRRPEPAAGGDPCGRRRAGDAGGSGRRRRDPPAHDPDADLRPPLDRRRGRGRLPPDREGFPRGAGARAV